MKRSTAKNTSSDGDGEMHERVLAAAFDLFTENGYAGTSTLKIATRAKVSKRDLYSMFESKQAMLVACIQKEGPRGQLPPETPLPRNRKELTSILSAFATGFLTQLTHPSVIAMFRLAIAEAGRSPEVGQALEHRRAAVRVSMSEFLGRIQSAHLLAKGDPMRLANQYIALLWGGMMMGLLLGVRTKPSAAEIKDCALEATEAFLRIHGRQHS
ncbi:MAG: TetR/AcrR family transcriptional regulator [Burkholderia sp.]|jgi:AcrR family transcriptional regulator|nr:TetR/AcrR family transcriptional regulator [Burkholderia sp.]